MPIEVMIEFIFITSIKISLKFYKLQWNLLAFGSDIYSHVFALLLLIMIIEEISITLNQELFVNILEFITNSFQIQRFDVAMT